MKRVLCIWLPNWPLQRVRSERPELNGRPLVLYTTSARGICQVVACTRDAGAQGIAPGMSLAEAQALLKSPRTAVRGLAACFERHEPAANLAELRKLTARCQQFSPWVGVEQVEAPETLILDVTGCAPLFGGERALTERALRMLAAQGLEGRAAMAGTIGAAWAVAHYGRGETAAPDPGKKGFRSPRAMIVPPGHEARVLSPLPVEALRLRAETVTTLHELHLRSIGQLEALPRAAIPSRFGPQVIERLDQALGRAEELLIPEQAPEPVQAGWCSEFPVNDRRQVEWVLEELIGRILDQLAPRGEAVQQLFCRLKGSRGEPAVCSVGLVRGSASPQHLLELLSIRLERMRLTSDVSEIHLLAGALVPLELRQEKLFSGELDADIGRELTLLIDRLSNRLGRKRVLRSGCHPDAQPEYAADYEPWIGDGKQARSKARELVVPTWGWLEYGPCLRPLLLKYQPAAIEVMSVVPDGPPFRFHWKGREHVIARSWGPERVETGWWRKRPIRRDYYRVETSNGFRFWLFCSLDEGDWFLQGEFG